MRTQYFNDEAEWMIARRGKITGTRVSDVTPKAKGTGEKKGFYEIVAEMVSVVPEGEDLEKPMERGKRLEQEAMKRFMIEKGLMVDTSLVLWLRDDDERIAVSPDGIIAPNQAVEVKCLSSANHIEAWFSQKIPSEYEDQARQYFVVNPDLQKLYFVFYDPRIPCKDFFIIEKDRDEAEVTSYLEMERLALLKIESYVARLKA